MKMHPASPPIPATGPIRVSGVEAPGQQPASGHAGRGSSAPQLFDQGNGHHACLLASRRVLQALGAVAHVRRVRALLTSAKRIGPGEVGPSEPIPRRPDLLQETSKPLLRNRPRHGSADGERNILQVVPQFLRSEEPVPGDVVCIESIQVLAIGGACRSVDAEGSFSDTLSRNHWGNPGQTCSEEPQYKAS
eukprot:CAMPEP_0204330928 /NCGR_PEP_ID=MMETSP0469-20131031/15312_1 /ASSEMBLY_ACC=CAM_ASM_000384 /TAXON_ID=2969 /ORGANISM="Oxyrrhis marina" /LENGTH=190 /DNA_ID=CAMNT_0051313827 /DNA_START=44 /DNA_END=615 /DNA_ORIENTATION=+